MISSKRVIGSAAAAAAALALAGPASANSADRFCGQAILGVSAGSHTTCAFAKDVARAYLRSGAQTVRVYSKAAKRTITMRCRMVKTIDSPYSLCTGGNGARVLVTS